MNEAEPVGRGTAVVVGAGIGGLATAIALRAAGWDVTVLERAVEVRPVGAGISLWSNGLRALESLGVGAEIRAHGTVQGQGGLRTPGGHSLTRMSGEQLRDDAATSVLLVHRADVHRALLDGLPPGTVVTGATVTGVRQDDATAVVEYLDERGEPRGAEADLVVGADGIHSRVRHAVAPVAPPPRYAGFTAWRGVTAEPYPLGRLSETWGRGAVFGLTQLIDGRVYWFATANEPAGRRGDHEHAEVLRRFGSWHSPIADVVRRTDPRAVLRHDIHAHPLPLAPFVAGRIALVGDAAHAVTPNLGQGGCLALEDAVVLAAEVSGGGTPTAALARYDAVRRPRAQRISRQSSQMSRVAQASNPFVAMLRSGLLAAAPARLAAAQLARTVAWTPPMSTVE